MSNSICSIVQLADSWYGTDIYGIPITFYSPIAKHMHICLDWLVKALIEDLANSISKVAIESTSCSKHKL